MTLRHSLKFGFIVEGFHDETVITNTIKLESDSDLTFPVFSLGNNGVTKHQFERIRAFRDNGVTMFIAVDPDKAGDEAAQKLQAEFPDMLRLEFDPKQCEYHRPNRTSYGVQYTTTEHVVEVIENLYNKLDLELREEAKERFYDSNRDSSYYKALCRQYLALAEAISIIRYGTRFVRPTPKRYGVSQFIRPVGGDNIGIIF
jgi:5S rRNA maturation endonuclease (ribonuclease M5)